MYMSRKISPCSLGVLQLLVIVVASLGPAAGQSGDTSQVRHNMSCDEDIILYDVYSHVTRQASYNL
jgi:hypothetical protein